MHLVKSAYSSPHEWNIGIKWFIAATLLLTMCLSTAEVRAEHYTGRVVGVTDGDTVKVQDSQQITHKIRLAGIDAPESKMPYGFQSTAFLRGLVLGREVEVVWFKKDRYGRTVATLIMDGKDVNLTLIQGGFAWHYKRYAKEQSVSESLAYEHAEDMARTNHLALWQEARPTAPWKWREELRFHQSECARTNQVRDSTLFSGGKP